MKRVLINGRIFEYPITGVGRFSYEVLLELDKIAAPGEYILGISKGAMNVPKLNNITVTIIGKRRGIIWEQVELPLYALKHKLMCLSMSNSVPLLKHDYILIHDISLKVNKTSGSFSDRLKIWWPLIQYQIGIKKSRVLFTVSRFQRDEIKREYKTSREIIVVYEGWQHMDRIKEDETVLDRYNLSDKNYVFAISTRTKNKNFIWIMKAAENNPQTTFVVSGKMETKYFSDDTDLEGIKNIVTTGYVTDEEMKGLMKHAKAFIYPSLYEGFGIPPLEAISVGTTSIVAETSCLPEIYGNSVCYVDPMDYKVDIEKLLEGYNKNARSVLDKYNWKYTAEKIRQGING